MEILSPGGDPLDVTSKIEVYLRGDSTLAIVVDPKRRTFTLHDATGATAFAADDTVRHDAIPDFALPVGPSLRRSAYRCEAGSGALRIRGVR